MRLPIGAVGPGPGWVLLSAALVASACRGAPPQPEPPTGEEAAAELERRGEELYRSHGCIACHGPEGLGDGLLGGALDPAPRNLRDTSSYRQGHSVEEISRTIGMGVLGRTVSPMPSYPHLSRADKDALAAWIVSQQEQPPASGPGPLGVRGGWVRAVPPAARATAAYLTLDNPGGEDVIVVAVAADGFQTAEIHESLEVDGVHRMRPLERLVVPAGGAVELAAGATHLMLIGPEAPVAEGEERLLRLRFEDGAEQSFSLPVRRREETP